MEHKAHWSNGKKTVSGCWVWQWASQRFVTDFDVPLSAHGEKKRHWVTANETPEIGPWKLVRSTDHAD